MKIKNWLLTIGIIFLVLVLAFLLLFLKSLVQPSAEEELTICLANKTTLFSQKGCHYCRQEEDLFGEYYELLNVIDCVKKENADVCFNSGIRATPSWVLNNGTILSGFHSLEELKEMTGC